MSVQHARTAYGKMCFLVIISWYTLFFVITLKCTAEKRHTYLYWDYSGVEVGVATLFLSVHSIS